MVKLTSSVLFFIAVIFAFAGCWVKAEYTENCLFTAMVSLVFCFIAGIVSFIQE